VGVFAAWELKLCQFEVETVMQLTGKKKTSFHQKEYDDIQRVWGDYGSVSLFTHRAGHRCFCL